MFKKILVALDLTEASTPALRTAVDLARRLGATLEAAHVIEGPYQSTSFLTYVPASAVEAVQAALSREDGLVRDRLNAAVTAAGGSDLTVAAHVEHGIPADIIPALASKIGADLIVMGTHGRRGFQHAVMGSVAERVVRTAAQPVLVIRAASEPPRK
jgi:nucleotide-binding universal stress UspA family protein